MQDFLIGFSLPARALDLLRQHRELRRYCWWPVVLNIFVFVLVFWLGATFLNKWMDGMLPAAGEGGLRTAARGILYVFFLLLFLIVAYFAFVVIGSLVALPFNDLLSERVERILGLQSGPGPGFGFQVALVWQEIVRITIAGVLFLFGLSLNLIPLLGSVASLFFNAYVAAWFVAMEFTSFSLERRGFGLLGKLRVLRSSPRLSLGLGSALGLLLLIPFANLFVLPLGTISGTLLVAELEQRNSLLRESRNVRNQ
ncbi:MAG: EI24 domain-containing protein [bacterium]